MEFKPVENSKMEFRKFPEFSEFVEFQKLATRIGAIRMVSNDKVKSYMLTNALHVKVIRVVLE